MLYFVDEDGFVELSTRDMRTYLFVDHGEIARGLRVLAEVVRGFVVHRDEYPEGPVAPSSAGHGRLHPVCLREEMHGMEYPAHPMDVENPDGDPGLLDWGLMRIGETNIWIEHDHAAAAVLVECIEREIDPQDTAEALYGAARQIARYAPRYGNCVV